MMHHEDIVNLASDDDESIKSHERPLSSGLVTNVSPDRSPPRARLRRGNTHLSNISRATTEQHVISLLNSPDNSHSRQSNSSLQPDSTNENSRNTRQRDVNEQWACRRCTLLNPLTQPACSACMTVRNDTINLQDSDEVIYERTTRSQNPSSHFVGGGAFLGGMLGAADGYANGTGVARGAVRGVVSGAVGGALIGEVLRPMSPPTVEQFDAAVAPNRTGQSTTDGWGRRNLSSTSTYTASFNTYPSRTYIRNNPTVFDHLLQSMNMQRQQPNIDEMSYERLLEVFGDGNENRNLAASPEVIFSLPSSTVMNPKELPEDKRQCVICMEEYVIGDKRTMLPCWHGFHKGCVVRWLESKGCCPICKSEVG